VEIPDCKILKDGVTMLDSYLNEELAKDHVARSLRESERKRLIREIEGPGKARDGWQLLPLALGSLLALVVTGLV
jgi:hypothetical protein